MTKFWLSFDSVLAQFWLNIDSNSTKLHCIIKIWLKFANFTKNRLDCQDSCRVWLNLCGRDENISMKDKSQEFRTNQWNSTTNCIHNWILISIQLLDEWDYSSKWYANSLKAEKCGDFCAAPCISLPSAKKSSEMQPRKIAILSY